MDDFVLFNKSKREARTSNRQIADYLSEQLQLKVNPASSFLNQRSNGLRFLGTKIFPNHIRILPKNLKRLQKNIERKTKFFEVGQLSEEKYLASLNSYWAFLSQYDTYALRKEWVFRANSRESANRVIRGGSWNNNPANLRVANRNNNDPSNRNNNVGFRPTNTDE